MITGELKSKVDKAWNSCWTAYLPFIYKIIR